jgi:hypothetical protein
MESGKQELMDNFTLYRDLADLLTVVAEDGRGWPGAYWSAGLFVTDAWAISRRRRTELNRPTPAWARRLAWPEPIARWSRCTGELMILDDTPGWRSERYLGMIYDPERWAILAPDAFAVAIRAAASCPLTAATAAEALSRASHEQLNGLLAAELKLVRRDTGARSPVLVR